MIELVLATDDANSIRAELTGEQLESCAIMYGNQIERIDGVVRILIRHVQFPEQDDYIKRGKTEVELKPEFVARITKRARTEGLTLVFVHGHLGTEAPHFSQIDGMGEKRLAEFLTIRHPNLLHMSLVVSAGGMRARQLGTNQEARVVSIGKYRNVIFDPDTPVLSTNEMFDRQVRAFGRAGQNALQDLRIAIIGLGGTGSLIAQQLVHLGVRNFVLVDPDVIESTNLNRVANAFPDNIFTQARYSGNLCRNASTRNRVAAFQYG